MTDMFNEFGDKAGGASRWAGDTHYSDKTTLRSTSDFTFRAPATNASHGGGDIPAGGGITGTLALAGEVDTYRIAVHKGEIYTVNLNGAGATPVDDTFVVVFDEKGKLVGYDDDGGIGLNSLFTFKAQADGVYYVQARSFTAEGQAPTPGDYNLTFNRMGPDAAPDAIAGAVPLQVDSSIVAFTNSSGEGDVYRITLEAGEYYEFQVAGGADYEARLKDANGKLKLGEYELDTRIAIYDAAGRPLAFNDDLSFPGDLSSAVAFSPQVSGEYFVRVFPYAGDPGGYNLQVKQVDLDSLDPRDTIDWGTQLDSNTITVYFVPAGETYDGVTSLGWNAYEMQQAMVAFQQYENIIDVDFVVTDDAANATFKLVTTVGDGPLGYFNPPGETNEGVGVFWRDGFGWEENGEGGLEQGGYGFITLIHEIGHGMGLAHPHDDGGSSVVLPGAFGPFGFYGAFDLNQGVYSTMSYNDGWQLHPDADGGFPVGDPSGYGYQGTMMALDISVLQEKYGANTSFASGANVYALDDVNAVGTFYETIWDTGGVDSIVYTGARDAVIDLRAATLDYSFTGAGALSWVDGVYGGFTIANGVVVENASGGSGNDVLIGNDAVNTLTGNGGADVFRFAATDLGDVITDFLSGTDKIDVSRIDANASTAADDAFVYIGAANFSAAGQLRAYVENGDTIVEGDINGDGVADLRFTLDGSSATGSDFLL